MNSAPVFWTSKRRYIVTRGSAEAEYVALTACARQVLWLRKPFLELAENNHIYGDPKKFPTDITTDSSAAITLTKFPQASECDKHIEIKIHLLKRLKNRK